MLPALDDLAAVLESAALGYTGELKSELRDLCERIDGRAPGYASDVVQRALPDLQAALAAYRGRRDGEGAGILSRVSRTWWQAFRR